MKINPINSASFQGLYKLDRNYIGDNTKQFLDKNDVIVTVDDESDTDVFVLTHNSKDRKFEKAIKRDKGKYCKSRPLSEIMYPSLLRSIFHSNIITNKYKENWTDYTDRRVSSIKKEEDKIIYKSVD